MEANVYQEMAELEREHWWFTARRQILNRLLQCAQLPDDALILEAGSGTGGNLAMLGRHGKVHAMELDASARELARRKNPDVPIESGRLPDEIPYAGQLFDAIVMFDVLEHVDEDRATLAAIYQRLKPGGRFLLTVPAYSSLWSSHDETHHHKRRYRRGQLSAQLREAGYLVRYRSYFNFWLFPLIYTIRMITRLSWLPERGSDAKMPGRLVNQLLRTIFASERHLIGRVRLPFGVSIALIAEKPMTG